MQKQKLRAYLYLHFCVFVWGFTAILGKLISLTALPLVWWRVLICSLTLWFILSRPMVRALSKRMFWRLMGIGSLVGLHWVCFYGAIKLSNASVAVATMATTTFFSALTEPFLLGQRVKWYELLLGILILPGIVLVVGSIDWTMRMGFAVGIVGAFLAAVFTALNKQVIDGGMPGEPVPAPLVMSFVELFGGLAVTSLVLPVWWAAGQPVLLQPAGWDWVWLLVLAWVCTLLPYVLTLIALRHISAFAANLTINLEPVYGVILAGLIFREDQELTPYFYVGVLIIIAAVFSHPFLKKIFDKNGPDQANGSTAA